MDISLTGNPFVDTGLAVLASLSGRKNIDELTLEDMKTVHRDGVKLTQWNSKLKSTSMIFTINSLATHPGIKPLERKIQLYSQITTAILNSIGYEDVHERCESCGNEYSLNLDELIRKTLVPLGYKDEVRFTGRDWFPLAGSMGSDAQALPASSRSPNLCAMCLFAVHYLPQGIELMDGRLVVSQSTSRTFWYEYVRSIVEKIQSRIGAGNFETLGSKEGSATVVMNILEVMDRIKKIDPGVSLFTWRFSNSGQSPDCSIEEIPNKALQFLFDANGRGLRREITSLIKRDKNPEYSLLNCIRKGTDYRWLYPSKKHEGVSPKFFSLYQTRVREVSETALKIAFRIAKYLEEVITDKKFDNFSKDIEKDITKRNQVRKHIANMVKNGSLAFSEYNILFSRDAEFRVRANNDAWKYIYYYMYQEEYNDAGDEARDIVNNNELLLYVGKYIYDTIIKEKGAERFERDVLNRFNTNNITISWLRRQFLKNAEYHEGFTYDNWKVLCLNDQGRESVYELLFRLRLMWTEWFRTGTMPEIALCPTAKTIPLETDLTSEHKEIVYKIIDDYIHQRGVTRFQKNVIGELRSGGKDLYWFRQKFSQLDKIYSDDGYWETFNTDPNGNSIKSLRFFQLSLLLINRFREQAFKKN